MHRVAISQVSSSERLDILFLSFFFPVLPFFYTIVVSTGSSKRRKKKNDGVYYSIRENEREREKDRWCIDARRGEGRVLFRENRKVRSKSPY